MKAPALLTCAAALVCATFLPAGPAHAAYECRNVIVTGVAAPQGRRAAAERDAERAWEAAARSQFGFNHRWGLAVKTRRPNGTNRNGVWTAQADAYPCRLTPVPISRLGTGGVASHQTRSEIVCQNYPNLENAKAHNCALFYVLGR